MKYVILCLATGDYVRLEDTDILKYCDDFVKRASNMEEINANYWNSDNWAPTLLTFDTHEAAHWFMRRRLSFNPRRTASQKLVVMDKVFKLNGINNLSSKVEYDIVEVEDGELWRKKVIGIDLDDVLCPFSIEFITYANLQLGTNKTVADMVTYRLDKVFGISYTKIIELIQGFMAQPNTNTFKPIAGAKETLEELSKTFDLQIITARLECYAPQTQRWLDTHLPGIFSAVHYCGGYDQVTKLMKCKEINAIALIDDNAGNIENVLSGGVIGILFGNYAWHRELSEDAKPIKMKTWKMLRGCYNTFLPGPWR